MNIHKKTKINIGGSTPEEIIVALQNETKLPTKAVATGIFADFTDIEVDSLLDSKLVVTKAVIVFEWDDVV